MACSGRSQRTQAEILCTSVNIHKASSKAEHLGLLFISSIHFFPTFIFKLANILKCIRIVSMKSIEPKAYGSQWRKSQKSTAPSLKRATARWAFLLHILKITHLILLLTRSLYNSLVEFLEIGGERQQSWGQRWESWDHLCCVSGSRREEVSAKRHQVLRSTHTKKPSRLQYRVFFNLCYIIYNNKNK